MSERYRVRLSGTSIHDKLRNRMVAEFYGPDAVDLAQQCAEFLNKPVPAGRRVFYCYWVDENDVQCCEQVAEEVQDFDGVSGLAEQFPGTNYFFVDPTR